MDKSARKKMIVSMEYIVRQINNEDFLMFWLSEGVPDGDIEYGNLDISQVDDYLIEDGNFKDIMTTFLKCMKQAWSDGGLYCDTIVSNDKND